jgi:hypothetical protein
VDELSENANFSLSRFLGSCRVLARCWHGAASLQWSHPAFYTSSSKMAPSRLFSSFFCALRKAGHTLDALLCTSQNPAQQSQKFGGSNPNMKIMKPEVT